MIGNLEEYFEPIDIHVQVEGYDDWGSPTGTSYQYNETIQGRIRQLSGDERYAGQSTTHVSTHRMYCKPTILSYSDRIVYRGESFDIININNVLNFDRLIQVDMELIRDGV